MTITSTILVLNASAYATVIYNLVKVDCDPEVQHFSWKAFTGSSEYGVGSDFVDVYVASPTDKTVMARAGYQYEPVSLCNFFLPFERKAEIRIFAEGYTGMSNEDWPLNGEHNVRLEVNDDTILTIDDIWGTEFDEHLIEVNGREGKHCTTKYKMPKTVKNQISEFKEQQVSCRFFRLPEPTPDQVKGQ